jgi:hypothetical protein
MFDGFHRKKDFPNARTVKCDQVKTPVDRALARMTVNFCRRHYTSEEMKNDIGLLIGSGLTVDQIMESTGISESTIYKYKPQELKDQVRVEAGKEAHRISQDIAPSSEVTVKTQDTAQPQISQRIQKETLNELVECAYCHMAFHVSKGTVIDDKNYCPRCAEHAKPQAKGVPQVKEYKPKETPEFRRGIMSPSVSKTEIAVLEELVKRGHKVQSQVHVCLFETVIDYIVDDGIPFYLDGKRVHQNRDWKDDFIREKLTQKLGRTVYAIPYEYFTLDAVKKIVDSMEEKT